MFDIIFAIFHLSPDDVALFARARVTALHEKYPCGIGPFLLLSLIVMLD